MPRRSTVATDDAPDPEEFARFVAGDETAPKAPEDVLEDTRMTR